MRAPRHFGQCVRGDSVLVAVDLRLQDGALQQVGNTVMMPATDRLQRLRVISAASLIPHLQSHVVARPSKVHWHPTQATDPVPF